MSSKLRVEPSPDITFEVAGGKPNSCPLRLYNSGTEHTAFKVKTTAPKKYCVRPNAGVIPPGKHVEVHVIPQVVKGVDPTLANDLAGKCKDKFMIQSTTVQGDQAPSSELWAQVPQAELQQTLLRCKYKVPCMRHAARRGMRAARRVFSSLARSCMREVKAARACGLRVGVGPLWARRLYGG